MSEAEPAGPGPGLGENAFGRLLGIEVLEVGPERVRARLEAGPRHHQPYGILHGGVYSALVEDVASQGAGRAARARGQRGVVGVANATDFYRSHSRGPLLVEGTPVHAGRSAHVWQVEIRRESDGKLVARGQVRFHVLDTLPGERAQGEGR
ncbi:MAG: PaaI family thioesterase [Myxococcota bacterium]|nr:PaaI family thioesterase [Myxococcota bacterium]